MSSTADDVPYDEGLHLIIPTYRRTEQRTFHGLPPAWQARTTFVVDAQDAAVLGSWLRTGYILEHPPEITTIAQKRAWLLRTLPADHIVMLDDDLSFHIRRSPDDPQLVPATPEEVGTGLEALLQLLQTGYVHAGFSPRQNNNTRPAGWIENTRMMYVLGYHVPTVQAECELGRIEHREDIDLTLQLLQKGYKNAVLTTLCVDQRYNNPGGASVHRTLEASNADAEKLAALFPGLVKVVERAYKGSVPRKEVICYWQKAYARSQVQAG